MFAFTSVNLIGYMKQRASVVIASLLGTWIMCFPYEGQVLYRLAQNQAAETGGLLEASLFMLVVGLVIGGLFVKTTRAANTVLIAAIPLCMLLTGTFMFDTRSIWIYTLSASALLAGVCITACGQIMKSEIEPDKRQSAAADILISMACLKMVISNVSMYVSIRAGIALLLLALAAALYMSVMLPKTVKPRTFLQDFDRKTGVQALVVLFIFIMLVAIDYGIMTQFVNPKYAHYGWLTSWYWLLPYVVGAYTMRRARNEMARTNLLSAAAGMIGLGFLLFFTLDYSAVSYLIVNTVMMGAWGVIDVFWWSKLAEMFEMSKNSAALFVFGFGALMVGVILGRMVAESAIVSRLSTFAVPLAAICLMTIVLPGLHSRLAATIKKSPEIPTLKNTGLLTARETQIVALILKGRTYKLIAAELHLSENTIKTHVKNIYSKLDVRNKSELYNHIME